MKLSIGYTINQVEEMFRNGQVSESDVEDYLDRYNDFPHHFYIAILRDGGIRLIDKDSFTACYGVRDYAKQERH
jgi:hypothetical protein